ncbi:bifunctional protein-serine/threonine kinase/phosphatase [Aquabacterium sp. J223]|uniref:bifunctional protein-serine/threonine kinase/phosphatase n=1 Tax=Aquabacterium sp. J223 TaxID=2898431 RepID=UPI0021ADB7A2|nr:bifunctional protein-serine/threonine kinase/phosphatase [Aquabacterium sp. J223]UUX95619.1 bifunctional protein-serine/threonine kinase/phosphatase [Aquabacterium sp. J223]
MTFHCDIGHASHAGRRARNEDFAGALRAEPHEAARGLIAAIADGVSAGGQGRLAAQTTVMALLQDFFAAPATWETTVVLDRLIGAQNRWLAGLNAQRGQADGATAMTTLTALALQGHGFTVAHVGDTRCWRLHGDGLQPLTQDHALSHPDLRNGLSRAIGLEDAVRVDYLQGELAVGDLFVLTTDGVHRTLPPARIAALAADPTGDAQRASQALVDAALAAGSHDNCSALVIRVLGLDTARLDDVVQRLRHLSAPPRLKVGAVIDGLTITALVADNGVHRLYQARDGDGRLVALKTLHEARAHDPEERAMLAHEAWLGARVTEHDGRGLVRVVEPQGATALYTLFDWHGGQTLAQWLAQGRRFSVAEAVDGALQVARTLGRLHRQGVIHRDVKPENLHLGDDGGWRLLDLGAALSGQEPAAQRELHAGTPSYMNPEQWDDGGRADAGSDLYALGVTLYRWLTGRLPYGEVEPWQTGRYRRDPVPPSRLRPDVPIWLDHLVLKAVARDARLRFETAEELALALERGASRRLPPPPATPLIRRDPALLWQLALAVSLLFNALLIVWLLFLPR